MNCHIHQLPELETATLAVREALAAVIHTVLFIRSPGPVSPFDVHCESFGLTYTRIATENDPLHGIVTGGASRRQNKSTSSYQQLDRKVDGSIEEFLQTLTPIGPELMAGNLAISFFERRPKKQLFGLHITEEKVPFEQWIVRVLVNNTPRPTGEDEASVIERQRIQDTAEGMLKAVMLKIFELANIYTDHVPSSMYDFDISSAKRADDREEFKVTHIPALINLQS
ncbi:hypothetical protein THAOC_21671 [Thalassiosira oceanica]|uniref:Autophagy-related protein 101 n=1 Tax=Thalassiosira oceanica TaxID=159749 RepID=K0SBE9_THAOC|nr:hypothetical protein THAOC_21671 [Thalassiosira oceanica]|mmetsp:Transcript_26724/g.63363  ORF Transcript_26724/g.63363 Transcript_26724/m.63363 type:complete len:226 (+) Transcript_26724:264-941(+)|eukprot:EJK58226.1 hypothetical protein THAOC_21671 [Thalassiosira oceanica]